MLQHWSSEVEFSNQSNCLHHCKWVGKLRFRCSGVTSLLSALMFQSNFDYCTAKSLGSCPGSEPHCFWFTDLMWLFCSVHFLLTLLNNCSWHCLGETKCTQSMAEIKLGTRIFSFQNHTCIAEYMEQQGRPGGQENTAEACSHPETSHKYLLSR